MTIEEELRYSQILDATNKQIIESLQMENYKYKIKTWALENTMQRLKLENDKLKRALRNEHETRLKQVEELELVGLIQGDKKITRQELNN